MRAAALVVIFVAFAIRVYRLDGVGLEGDEAFSIQTAYSSFSSILRLTSTAEPHPPLYYLFLHAWYPLAGTSEFALRFPSLIANVLTVAFLFKVADLFSWRAAGLVGAVLLTLNPYQVWYAQEARMYASVALFGLMAIYFALRTFQQATLRHMGFYAIFMLLGLYSHYYAFFLFLFTNTLLLWGIWRGGWSRRAVVYWLAIQLTIAVLYLPWLAFANKIVSSYAPFKRGTVDLIAIVKQSLTYYSLGLSVPADEGFRLSFGFLVIILIGLWFAGHDGHRYPAWFRRWFVLGYLLLPTTLGLMVSLLRPMFAPRYLMVSAPAFYMVLGLGLVGLYRKASLLGVVSVLLLVLTQGFSLYNHFYNYGYAKTDFREAVTYIERHAQHGDAIILDGWSQTLQFWYYQRLRAKEPIPSYLFPLGEPDGWQLAAQRLDEIMAKHRGIWLLDYDVAAYDPQHLVETHLAINYYQVVSARVGLNRVVYYASAPPTLNFTPLNISYEQEALLKGLSLDATSVRPGDILHLALHWQVGNKTARDYAVSWRLVDQEGRTVWQRDARPASGFFPSNRWAPGEEVVDRYGMPVPSFLPPGQYSLMIVVYDKVSGEASELRRDGQTLPRGPVRLAQIRVLDAPPLTALYDPATTPYQVNFSFEGLNLLGFGLDGENCRPGDTITVKLLWQLTKDSDQDYQMLARLIADNGEAVWQKTEVLGTSWFPTSRWRQGRTLMTYLDVRVPARASTGDYTLLLELKANRLVDKTFSGFPKVKVRARKRDFNIPRIAYSKEARFGSSIELLGYDLKTAPDEPIKGGQTVHLTLYWRALSQMDDSYKVFTHLIGADGQIYGQKDSVPLDGKAPTDGWIPGEVLADTYDIVVRPEAPTGKYELEVGFYQPEQAKRIPLADGSGDSLVVTSLFLSSGSQ
ncbi:MAG: glycosyltransferase family 39 protein [Chloroflexi bacterium]|nr:glycosyltransferase family 39 protein [Chloroflexota bacterium]MCL5074883.1 glycosyltransferase family 39 protein [Chloroflexota bacterium]